jgi:hypothetical protein
MFNYENYPFDLNHSAFEVGGEAMIFHCNHYLCYLQRSILDADYIDSRPFLIGAAADSAFIQLSNLSQGMNSTQIKQLAEEIYKASGYGLIDLTNISQEGGEVITKSSFYSKSWLAKFGKEKLPVDYFTSGYIAAAYAAAYNIPLNQVVAAQTECMATGDIHNIHTVSKGKGNFTVYPPKKPTQFKNVPILEIPWEHSSKVTDAFIGAHYMFVGNDDGLIPAFGVYVARNYSDYVNRLQIEFISEMKKVAGDYGVKLGTELMLEAGHACGFFTYGGIMSSEEWKTAVKPYLKTKEDWIYGLLSLINTMGWGYHTTTKVSPECSVFRNYDDFEDMSYLRMYDSKAETPISWANSGGFTGLCHLIYKTGLTEGNPIDTEDGFRQMRRSIQGYKTKLLKGIASGDDFLEVEISL